MSKHETTEFVRKPQRVQAMQFKGWGINVDEIISWVAELGAEATEQRIGRNCISIISDSASEDLKPGSWVIRLGRYDFEICTDAELKHWYDPTGPAERPMCSKPIGYTGGSCGSLASYVLTLDCGIETFRCKSHMAMNLAKMELTNSELSTIQKI